MTFVLIPVLFPPCHTDLLGLPIKYNNTEITVTCSVFSLQSPLQNMLLFNYHQTNKNLCSICSSIFECKLEYNVLFPQLMLMLILRNRSLGGFVIKLFPLYPAIKMH